MKTLYEGILGDIDDTLSKSDKDIEKYRTFGKRFNFVACSFLTEATAGMLNSSALKKLTRNLDYMNSNIENGLFDRQNKFKMFLNWIDHLTFDELGVKPGNPTSDQFRMDLADAIENRCKKEGIFNNTDRTIIYCPTARVTGDDRIRVFIHRSDKMNIGVNLIYEIQ